MSKVFISHSSKDGAFRNRLVEILNNHGVSNWSSAHDLKGGDNYKDEINTELSKADCLLIIISKNSKKSNWVSREITYFQAQKPKSTIIPLRLDETDANKIYDGLGDYHVVDFSIDHISGYKQLLGIFEKEFAFSDRPQQRRKDDRRSDDRRDSERREDDRRDDERREKTNRRATGKAAMARRLRVGYLTCYVKETRNSEFHELDLYRTTDMLRFLDGVKKEAYNYEFIDKNQAEIEPLEALEKATKKVWDDFRELKSTIKIAYLIDELIGELLSSYTIELKDRRDEDRRSEERRSAERRDDERRTKSRREK